MKQAENEIMNENAFLMAQLKEMKQKRGKVYSSTRGRANPLKDTKFKPRAKKYNKTNSKLDYESAKEKAQYRKEYYAQLKDELELKNCTFKPNVDLNSMTLTQKKPMTPIDQRGVPDRYNRTLIEERKLMRTQELQEAELGTMKLPNNVGKKCRGADFYNEKVEWKKKAREKIIQKLREQEEAEIGTFVGKPVINDYSKNKIVGQDRLDKDPFLARLPKYLNNKISKIKTLDKKYYNYSHKPALYKPGRTGEINIKG
jgi:hypothetical protein